MSDKDIVGFEILHRHADFSVLDGFGKVYEYAEYAKQINQKYLCITDHGMMAAIPQQIRESDKHGLTPIFGNELYVNGMQPSVDSDDEYKRYVTGCNDADRQKLKKSYHLLALAYTDKGYENLVQLSSWAWIHGYGGNPRRPRVTHEQLRKYKEGIIFTSCCYLSEIGQAFDRGGDEAGEAKLLEYMEMFGDNFYLELMMLDFKPQKPYDAFLIRMHQKYGVPLEIATDTHYCKKEHSKYQMYMLMTRTKNTIHDIERAMKEGDAEDKFFELQDKNLWMKSEVEMNEKYFADYRDIIPYELYTQAKLNTVAICERAKNVKIDRSIKLPSLPNANERLWEEIEKGLKWRRLDKQPQYLKQIRDEFDLIARKNFASYFLIEKMFVDEARRKCPELLGWGNGSEALSAGRGSAVGFLTCYTLGITDVDPIKHSLLPERFLSDGRGGRQIVLPFKAHPTTREVLTDSKS